MGVELAFRLRPWQGVLLQARISSSIGLKREVLVRYKVLSFENLYPVGAYAPCVKTRLARMLAKQYKQQQS
jgi:hypothetical protein